MPSPRNAFSLSYQDVNAAINGGLDANGTNWSAAQDGDEVDLPPGSGNWAATQHLNITKNIKLIGHSGINSIRTAFVDATTITGAGANMISWTTTGSSSTALLKGVTLSNNNASSAYTVTIKGIARFDPTKPSGSQGGFRMTECKFKATNGSPDGRQFQVRDWVTGVVDHIFYEAPANVDNPPFSEMDTVSQPGFVGSGTSITASTSSVTLSTTSPAVHWTSQPLKDGQGLQFTGTLPAELSSNAVYFVVGGTSNGFDIALNPFGTPIVLSGTGSGVTATATNNAPVAGWYSSSCQWDWGNDFSAMYFEDCILQKPHFGIGTADGPPRDQAGGARMVQRHCSTWESFSVHGFDESGGNSGAGVVESYNNFLFVPTPALEAAYHNLRTCAAVYFNEVIVNSQKSTFGYAVENRMVAQISHNMVGPADGTNFFDQNARGGLLQIKTTLPTSQTYTPRETTATGSQTLGGATLNVVDTTSFPASGNIYVNTTANGTQAVAYTNKTSNSFTGCSGGTGSVANGAAVVGPLIIQYTGPGGVNGTFAPVVFQSDGTSPGVPVDIRIGAVYAKGSGGSNTIRGGKSGTAATYVLPGLGTSSDPANLWVGFTLRNRSQAAATEAQGGQVDPVSSTGYSIAHIVTLSNWNGSATVLTPQFPHDDMPAPGENLNNGDAWEMRFVVNGVGFPGMSALPLTNGAHPRASYYVTNNGNNKYWHGKPGDGVWYWNMKQASLANFIAKTNITDANFEVTVADKNQGDSLRLVQGGINNLTRTGYPTQTPDRAHLRIGADWDSGSFGGPSGPLKATIEFDDSSLSSLVRATQAWGAPYPHPLTVTAGGAPSINSSATATGQVGVPFSYQIGATNSPTSYNATGLPAGLSVNTATGVISGTPTTAATTSVTISATNGTGTGSATLTLTINPATPVITSAGTASGQVGVAFSYQIVATNSPTSFAATGLPAGLNVNTSTGIITGTPTTGGTSSVTVKATNAGGTGTKILTLTIAVAAPVITSPTTATGAVGSAFSYQIVATNSPTFYNASGLPGGLTVNTATGLISGTPTTAGSSSVTLIATNAGGTGNATLSLTINSTAAPVITSSLTANGTVGSAFSYQITATNSPTSFGATSLPSGLSVNTSTGVISGTPSAPGLSHVAISATNAGGTGTAILNLTVTDTTAPTVVITSPSAGAVSGIVTIIASASDNIGVAGVQFKINGTNLTPEITSSPYQILWDTTTLTPASYSLTAVARDAAGNTAISATVTVTVADQSAPTVSITSPVDGGYVSGTVLVVASASDNVGVVGVQFKLDGSNLNAEVTSSPYQTSWVTTSLINGIHTLSAVARDAAGNTTTSAVISVHVNNDLTPPLITGVTAINVTTTTATITWTTDELSDSQVDYGTTSGYGTSTTLDPTLVTSHSVNLTGLIDATTYHFRVDSRDAAGNLAQSTDFTFMTGILDTTPPIITITAPTAATVVSGTWIITADASDDVGVAGVQFIVSTGHNVGPEITAAPYSVSWNTTLFTDGAHDITAVARDTSGNVATSSPVTVTVSNGPRGQGRKKRLLG